MPDLREIMHMRVNGVHLCQYIYVVCTYKRIVSVAFILYVKRVIQKDLSRTQKQLHRLLFLWWQHTTLSHKTRKPYLDSSSFLRSESVLPQEKCSAVLFFLDEA